jgi:hypothetical protein
LIKQKERIAETIIVFGYLIVLKLQKGVSVLKNTAETLSRIMLRKTTDRLSAADPNKKGGHKPPSSFKEPDA